jgi:hypothetical protein
MIWTMIWCEPLSESLPLTREAQTTDKLPLPRWSCSRFNDGPSVLGGRSSPRPNACISAMARDSPLTAPLWVCSRIVGRSGVEYESTQLQSAAGSGRLGNGWSESGPGESLGCVAGMSTETRIVGECCSIHVVSPFDPDSGFAEPEVSISMKQRLSSPCHLAPLPTPKRSYYGQLSKTRA